MNKLRRSYWDQLYEKLMDLYILRAELDVTDSWFRRKYKEWIYNIRIMPKGRRAVVINSLYHIAKFAMYSIFFVAHNEKEVPGRLQKVYRRVAARCDTLTWEPVWKALVRYKTIDPLGIMYSLGSRHGHFPTSKFVLPILPQTYRKLGRNWGIKKPVKLKVRKERAKIYLRRVLFTPFPDVLRAHKAPVYFSKTSELYFVLSSTAMGRGKNVKEAVEDYVSRWRLLANAEINTQLPINLYMEKFQLEKIGDLYLVEFENKEVKWCIKWEKHFDELLNIKGSNEESEGD